MTAIVTALIGMVGSAFGALVGVLANSKMINYRLEQLENRVQAHNNLIDRMYKVERDHELTEEKMKVMNHRISDLENSVGNE